MPDPTYWTTAGFKTLKELKASVEQCAEVVRYAKTVEEAATEVMAARSVLS